MAKKKTSFEEAIAELEKIVDQLEQGEMGLADSLKLFEQGVNMSRICNEHLEKAEKKIEYLLNPELSENELAQLPKDQIISLDSNISDNDEDIFSEAHPVDEESELWPSD